MSKPFQKEIEKVKKNILHLTAMVEENLQVAVRSVTDKDIVMAEAAVARDDEIDQMEVELEEDCLKIMALHQPVAIDLRFLIATLKINSDLERIGDLAVNIAEMTPILVRSAAQGFPFDLDKMLDLAMVMVKNSSDALVDLDVKLAEKVCLDDDELDDLHAAAYDSVTKEVRTNPAMADYYISLLSISRYLERIGDHATNIAEDVIYMVDGEIVRHRGGSVLKHHQD